VLITQKDHLRLSKKEFEIIDRLCGYSKNLFNVTLYEVRKHYKNTEKHLKYKDAYHIVKSNENYKLLLSSCAQQTMKIVDRSYNGFFGLLKIDQNITVNPPKFLPKNGKFACVFPQTGFRIKGKKLLIGLSKTFRKVHQILAKDLEFIIPRNLRSVDSRQIKEIRIIPRLSGKYYDIEYIYKIKKKSMELELDSYQYLAIDLGLNNFATTIDTTNGTSEIIDGRYIKSINQWYNKEKARLQSIKDKQKIKFLTNREALMLQNRDNKINEFLNLSVNHIIKHCLNNKIGNLVLGDFHGIKQKIRLGKKTNQNFVQIPFFKFKQKLKSKCELHGIKYYIQEESYTSKCDALALEPIEKQVSYLGKRIKRGLFKSSTGVLLNADTNGVLNILRKVAGDSSIQGIISRGLVNRPRRIRLAFHTNIENDLQTSSVLNCSVVAKVSNPLKTIYKPRPSGRGS